MELVWKRDIRNVRVSTINSNKRYIIVRVYSTGLYAAMEILGKSLSGRLSTITIFSGKKDTLEEAMTFCEEKISEILEDFQFKISVENNICTITVPKNSEVRYTTNGKDVKKTNKIYKEPFEVEPEAVVKAVAFFEDGTASNQISYPEEN